MATKLRGKPEQGLSTEYHFAFRHGVPKGCKDGNVYEWVQEKLTVPCKSLYVYE
jgi:hypothetical protein